MYIRQSSRTYKGKTYINYVLVESILTPKGPRQKIICSLGDLRPRPHAEWLALAHKLSSALSGQADLLDTPAPDSELQDLLAQGQSAAPPSLVPVPAALVPRPSGSPWLTNSPPLCPAKPTSSTLPRPTASGRISSPKCSPLLHLRGRPTRLTRLPPTPTS